MRGLLVVLAAALACAASTVAAASTARSLPCLPGELRPTLKITRSTNTVVMRVDVRNIGGKCTFRTRGAIVRGPLTKNVLSKRGTPVEIPRGRTARLTVVWSNWCSPPGPAQVVLKIFGQGKELALGFVPPPGCKNPSAKVKVGVGKPVLLPKRK